MSQRHSVQPGALALLCLTMIAAGCPDPELPPEPPEPPQPAPPQIDGSRQSASTLGPGELLELEVTASDPQGEPLLFTWVSSTGLLSPPEVRGDGVSGAVWTELSCLPSGTAPEVKVTVTNASGLSTSKSFSFDWSGPACRRPACALSLESRRITLAQDCTTDLPLLIPDGYTLDGAGHTLTAVDPEGGHFTGPVVRNRGPLVHVRNLVLRAEGLASSCQSGQQRLRGILIEEAAGSVVDTQVRDIQRERGTSGCQEGTAIEVRAAAGSERRRVVLMDNRLSGYQKVGVAVSGQVEAIVSGNEVDGGGPVDWIVRNGIQLTQGATGRIQGNRISGNAFTRSDSVAAGILVVGGAYFLSPLSKDVIIEGNELSDNDIGVYLSQLGEGGNAPPEATRIRVANNVLHNGAVMNGVVYQAGVSDFGTGNIITSNLVSGIGYGPATLIGSTFAIDVAAGPAAQLAFITGRQEPLVGRCSQRLTVQSQDAAGNLAQPQVRAFTLTASGEAASGVTFHADPGCGDAPISQVDLRTAHAEAGFYLKASQPGAVVVTVSGGGMSVSQEQTVRPL